VSSDLESVYFVLLFLRSLLVSKMIAAYLMMLASELLYFFFSHLQQVRVRLF